MIPNQETKTFVAISLENSLSLLLFDDLKNLAFLLIFFINNLGHAINDVINDVTAFSHNFLFKGKIRHFWSIFESLRQKLTVEYLVKKLAIFGVKIQRGTFLVIFVHCIFPATEFDFFGYFVT